MTPPEIISRGEATRRGLALFFTGLPCKHGHIDFRRTIAGGVCLSCEAANRKKHRSTEGYVQAKYARKQQCPLVKKSKNLKYLYGITADDLAAILDRQGNVCAICARSFGTGHHGPHVDHDHDTGTVRGALCGPCNRGIGLLRDSSALLSTASDYLRGHGK